MIRILLASLALSVPAATAAHTFWLQPEQHSAAASEAVQIDFRIGDTGEDARNWGLFWERIVSLRLFGPYGAVDLQNAVRTTAPGEPGGAVVAIDSPGTYVVAFESTASFSELEAGRFDAYVAKEGLAAIAAHRAGRGQDDGPGTELYSRRAKTLIQVGRNPTGNVTQPIGQTLEIVPLQNPFDLEPGEPLELQVLWRGRPLEGAMLTVASLEGSGPAESLRTGADGVVRLSAMNSAPTLYSVVWGVPAPNDARADYVTVFASLTVGSR